MRNVTDCQQKLIALGYLSPTYVENGETKKSDDGRFGGRSLDAFNHYRASLGRPPIIPKVTMEQLNADLFPDEQPAPAPRSNPLDNPIIRIGLGILLNQLTKGLIPMNFLSGYKTYFIALIMILLAVAGLLGWTVPGVNTDPGPLFLAALGLITGRTATAKVANGG